jgi:hypothetical protein
VVAGVASTNSNRPKIFKNSALERRRAGAQRTHAATQTILRLTLLANMVLCLAPGLAMPIPPGAKFKLASHGTFADGSA